MTMDAHTLELLEFHKIRELVGSYAFCSLGKDLALQAEPSTNADSIRAELGLVSELVEALGQGQAPPFAGLRDVRMLARRAAIGAMLTAEQLLEVAGTLTCTGQMYRWRMRFDDRFPRLTALLGPIEDLGQVAKSIAGCIDSRGHVLDMASSELAAVRQKIADLDEKVQTRIRHLLRDPELRKILRYPNATMSGDHYVLPVAVNYRHKLTGVIHRTSSTGETVFIEPAEVASLSAERVVVKSEEDREVKKILRRLSAEVGKVARPLGFAIEAMAKLDYVTAKARYASDYNLTCPDINTEGRLWLRQARHPLLEYLKAGISQQAAGSEEAVNSRQSAGSAEEAVSSQQSAGSAEKAVSRHQSAGSAEEAVSRQQSAGSTEEAGSRQQSAGSTEEAVSRQQSAGSTEEAVSRQQSAGGTGSVAGSSLPAARCLLPAALSLPAAVVPIDVRLGQPFNLLVITGPNTGGKTVTLKTTGLLCLMAQTGLHIPAAQGSSVPIFEQILADIGDEQSLEQSLSTFSSHISRIAYIFELANQHSLVLLDELGAGTDPVEGAALGRAILDQLDEVGCRAMVTTHLGDLKTYAFHNPRAENAAVEFDIETLRPTYRLLIGQFGMSNALKIARRLKLPRDLLKRARKYLRRRQRRAPELIQLQQKREEAEKARTDALQAQLDAEQQRDEYARKVAEFEKQQRDAAALLEWRSKLLAGATVWVPKYDKHGKVVRSDAKRGIAIINLGLGQWDVPFEEIFPQKDV